MAIVLIIVPSITVSFITVLPFQTPSFFSPYFNYCDGLVVHFPLSLFFALPSLDSFGFALFTLALLGLSSCLQTFADLSSPTQKHSGFMNLKIIWHHSNSAPF